jgi:hypothetical protein
MSTTTQTPGKPTTQTPEQPAPDPKPTLPDKIPDYEGTTSGGGKPVIDPGFNVP